MRVVHAGVAAKALRRGVHRPWRVGSRGAPFARMNHPSATEPVRSSPLLPYPPAPGVAPTEPTGPKPPSPPGSPSRPYPIPTGPEPDPAPVPATPDDPLPEA